MRYPNNEQRCDQHIDTQPALTDAVYSPYIRINRTAFALHDSHFNPVIVARNRMEKSRTERGRMFWLLVGQKARDLHHSAFVARTAQAMGRM